jgi:DNA-binding CsgD family transcriptional regulator
MFIVKVLLQFQSLIVKVIFDYYLIMSYNTSSMDKERGNNPRFALEEAIQDKILAGDIAGIVLPQRDRDILYRMALGEKVGDFAPRVLTIKATSAIHSLRYIRQACNVESTEQALSMLVARGIPFPSELLPTYIMPEISEYELEVLKEWLSGRSYKQIDEAFALPDHGARRQIEKATRKINAVSSIQLAAVVMKEGLVSAQKEDDGSFRFEIVREHPQLRAQREKEAITRVALEKDIRSKIDSGDVSTLHIPSSDMQVFYRMALGESVGRFAQAKIGVSRESVSRSLLYLRDAFYVSRVEQAFGMLIARGFPFPQELMPHYDQSYKTPLFTPKPLETVKEWVEGKPLNALGNRNFQVLRKNINAASNMQVVAVAIKEGFLLPIRHKNGVWTFETVSVEQKRQLPDTAVIFTPDLQ